MIAKIAIILFLTAIVAALFFGLFFMLKDKGNKQRMLTALSMRVGLQFCLILFLLLAAYMGWITPHSINGK